MEDGNTMRIRNLVAALAALAQSALLPNLSTAAEQELRSRLEKRVYQNADGESLPYRLFLPQGYDADKKYPLVLFLHGLGERGSDNEFQLKHAEVLRFTSDEVQAEQPCFLVAPQCPLDSKWVRTFWGLKRAPDAADEEPSDEPSRAMRLVMGMLDSLESQFSIDPDHRYVTGLSMGGYGTYDLCLRRPDEFAAAVPICGGVDPSRASQIAHVRFWIFHGRDDPVVPVELSRAMVKALKAAGAMPTYTEYEGVQHNSWNKAYHEPGLVEWVFSQRRFRQGPMTPDKKGRTP